MNTHKHARLTYLRRLEMVKDITERGVSAAQAGRQHGVSAVTAPARRRGRFAKRVIAGLMVAGRMGASMAAEIGTMRVTEQIDALTTLSTHPTKYLIAPRILAGVVTLPILVLIADIIGVFGGYLVGVYKLGFNPATYIKQSWDFLERSDVNSGLIKAAVFGFIITAMGCYQGYYSKGGAQGVGKATTNAVVSASILILIANYLLTAILFEA